ncbi:MAG: LptA/OstA family protein [Paracoccaceae bacterium]|jgi:lipopolysaccharide export system protein LptA|nr:LptA/OstA family protein [Paracoccaceae bacterium]
MNFFKTLMITVVLSGLFSSISMGQSVTKPGTGFKFDNSLPLTITSNQLNVEQNVGKATFIGDVVAKQGNLILSAEELVVEYEMKNKRMTSVMKRLIANINVTLISEEQSAEAKKMVYDMKAEKIIMTGNVLVAEGASVSSGDKLTINLISGSRKMEGNVRTVIISEDKDE